MHHKHLLITFRKTESWCRLVSFRKSTYLLDTLTTAYVLGLKDENIYRKLLAEKYLTLDRAIATAQSLQIADKEAREMAIQSAAATVDAINTHKRAKKLTRTLPPGPCPACGSKEHWCSECPHKNTVCHHTGHLAKVCRDKNSTTNDTGGNNPRRQAQSKSNQNHRAHLIETTNEELAINEQLQILETHVTSRHEKAP